MVAIDGDDEFTWGHFHQGAQEREREEKESEDVVAVKWGGESNVMT